MDSSQATRHDATKSSKWGVEYVDVGDGEILPIGYESAEHELHSRVSYCAGAFEAIQSLIAERDGSKNAEDTLKLIQMVCEPAIFFCKLTLDNTADE